MDGVAERGRPAAPGVDGKLVLRVPRGWLAALDERAAREGFVDRSEFLRSLLRPVVDGQAAG